MVRAGLAEMGMGRERCPPGPRPRREAVGEEAAGVASPPHTTTTTPPRQPAFPAALMVLGCYLQLRPGPWSLKCLFPGRASAWETTGHPPPPPSPSSWPQVCPTEGAALLLHPTESVCGGVAHPPFHTGVLGLYRWESGSGPPTPPKTCAEGLDANPCGLRSVVVARVGVGTAIRCPERVLAAVGRC